jgi:hypothetical protein
MQTALVAAVSLVVGAVITGLYSLRAKRNEYVNDYYKTVIARRVTAYERLETLIVWLKTSVVDENDNRPYHILFASDDYEKWERAFFMLHENMSQGLWLSDEIFVF